MPRKASKLRALVSRDRECPQSLDNEVEISYAALILLLFCGGWPALLTKRIVFGGGRPPAVTSVAMLQGMEGYGPSSDELGTKKTPCCLAPRRDSERCESGVGLWFKLPLHFNKELHPIS